MNDIKKRSENKMTKYAYGEYLRLCTIHNHIPVKYEEFTIFMLRRLLEEDRECNKEKGVMVYGK